MKTETVELGSFLESIEAIVLIVLFVLFFFGLLFGWIVGPLFLISGFFVKNGTEADNFIIIGTIFSCISLVCFLLVRSELDPFEKFDSWLKRNFGHKVVKEIPDKDNVKSYSGTTNYSSVKREEKHYSGSYKTSAQPRTIEDKKQLFKDYINNEIEKISYNNTLEDKRDKEAATFIAVNNIRHSPDVIASIYNISIDKANEIEESITVDEEKKVANHISYEGRIGTKDKNKMKSLLGYRCAACGKDMSEIYGNIGHNYIELHHLVPYSEMKENETRTLTEHEFCVLCPDCHRMIHKLPDASDIDMLIRIIRLNKK